MNIFIGVDIGGTNLKFGVFDPDMNCLKKWSIPTDLNENGKKIISDVAKEINNYMASNGMEDNSLKGIGMGIPGPVDRSGKVSKCVDLHWFNFNPVEDMKHYFPQIAIHAENDANVAALGEYTLGAGKNYDSIMLVTLGTGVGGGIILNGKIISGAHGLAGEIGHITAYESETDQCNCGNTGCIDIFASATGIVRVMKRLAKKGKRDLSDGITAAQISEMAKNGDAMADECLNICMGALGKGLSIFSHAFDPEAFIIAGGCQMRGPF